jgi:polysaccharide export outer membrane protein
MLILLMISSCVSRKEMVYFQKIEQLNKSQIQRSGNNLEIRPDDLLTIRVSAPEQEAAIPFNLTKTIQSSNATRGDVEPETYMVSNEGTIEFPILGSIEVARFTTFEVAEKIKSMITDYVKDPIVNVRVLNFQISVLGEVAKPGTFNIEDDHISVSKALAMAGDLTIHGKRENILVMGETEGEKTYAYLDFTDANVVNSPHYYLRQNDVVYVEPKSTRRQTAGSTGLAATYLSIASVLASLILLFTK